MPVNFFPSNLLSNCEPSTKFRSAAEISLNGGIVSNKGFIRQFAPPGTKIIAGKYVSAWGGIQSAGQTIGQIVCLAQFVTHYTAFHNSYLTKISSFNSQPTNSVVNQLFSSSGFSSWQLVTPLLPSPINYRAEDSGQN